MVTPYTVHIWLQEQAMPLAVILIAILALFLILKVSASHRVGHLMRERSGVTEETFTRHLQKYGFDPVIAASTYRYLQEVQRVRFPILPGDALDEDLGLDTEDIEQSMRELSESLGRRIHPGLLHTPIVTVEDLVRLLQASPRRTAQAA